MGEQVVWVWMRWEGVPLTITPPSRKALTQCLCHGGDGSERDQAKGHDSDMAWGGRVSGVEVCNFFWGIFDIFGVFPSVSFYAIAFPFD